MMAPSWGKVRSWGLVEVWIWGSIRGEYLSPQGSGEFLQEKDSRQGDYRQQARYRI